MTSHQQKGQAGEDAAAAHLERHGLKIIERNFRVRGGEIDLICRDGATTVFVEVRLRSRSGYGGAAASITAAKQARLILAARHWLARSGREDIPCRFDCVLIDGERLDWVRDAFSA
jgi:putative endonuclease